MKADMREDRNAGIVREATAAIPDGRQNQKNIILIGMPGSGKSTIGVLLAKTAGMGFVDTDLLIQHASGRLLYQMIEDDGIEAFIKFEENILKSVVCDNCVIATGGSAVYGAEAMRHMAQLGLRIYLKLPTVIVEKRIRNICTRGVVMRKGETMEQLYNERAPLYEKYADAVVDGAGTPEEIVERILEVYDSPAKKRLSFNS